jgi:hypothetical protein
MIVVFFRFTGGDTDADADPEVVFTFTFVEPGRHCRGFAGEDGFRGVAYLLVEFLPFVCSSPSSSLLETRAISLFFGTGFRLAGVASTSLFDDCKAHVC